MLLVVQILGAIGGLLVLIAGFVGAAPFVRLNLPSGTTLNAAQMTGVVRVLKSYLSWSLTLFAVGGIFLFAAFLIFLCL
ncbi:MAG TPA: hypothetical protein ACFYD2_02750 [Candidatus Avalokitesvara rifleensis]|uniref:hypothetical protein n=1 Tax=Candidatus Avalokitesvara rifleensis TaxID=3367620 RepID=UPI002714348C|nr:hypothetical protein [Candidatus Brocadiales bacterium]